MRTLHVVMGTTGEYSDREEWPVRAFLDEAAARLFVARAEAWLRARNLHAGAGSDIWDDRTEADASPFDAGLQVSYTGTRYYLMGVPLDDDVQRAIAAVVTVDRAARRAIALTGALAGEQEDA